MYSRCYKMVCYWPIHLSPKETGSHLLAKMGQLKGKYAPKNILVGQTNRRTDNYWAPSEQVRTPKHVANMKIHAMLCSTIIKHRMEDKIKLKEFCHLSSHMFHPLLLKSFTLRELDGHGHFLDCLDFTLEEELCIKI